MKANIKNITYVEQYNKFYVITEFSQFPIETFCNEQDAKQFIDGYLLKSFKTATNLNGEMFRNFVEIDLMSGTEYRKLRDLEVLMAFVKN